MSHEQLEDLEKMLIAIDGDVCEMIAKHKATQVCLGEALADNVRLQSKIDDLEREIKFLREQIE